MNIPKATPAGPVSPASPDTTVLIKTLPPKPWYRSKTIWGTITAAVGVVLGSLGVAADPSFAADGIQVAQDLEQLVAFVLAVGGYVLKEVGHRTADRPIGKE